MFNTHSKQPQASTSQPKTLAPKALALCILALVLCFSAVDRTRLWLLIKTMVCLNPAPRNPNRNHVLSEAQLSHNLRSTQELHTTRTTSAFWRYVCTDRKEQRELVGNAEIEYLKSNGPSPGPNELNSYNGNSHYQ